MAIRVLVVDDEKLIRWSISERLKAEGYEVFDAPDGAAAERFLHGSNVDLALLDLRLPDTDGITLLKKAREVIPDLPVIVITAHSSVDGAVEAMKAGAVDYITKPFNMDELAITVRRALENASVRQRLSDHVSQDKARFGLENIVGESRPMTEIKGLIRRVARSETTTVLLLGESGTGKDMMARALHYESNRVDRPFVNITCTALPETLLESELFGYEKGAFTDARVQKKGLFEVATGGTVFLDEIADMRPSLQSKLLRVLEEKAFKRIGGTEDVRVDVRVIAATNRDIDDAMRTGRFREDLYYRLSTVPILIPPLRERRDDIPLLVTHFLGQYNHEFHQSYRDVAPDALRKLLGYAWPGNVRELRNVIERAALLGSGEIILADDIVLGRSTLRRPPQDPNHLAILPDQGCKLEDVERDLVSQALERTGGNRTQAAELLGITRDQIRYKIEKFELPL